MSYKSILADVPIDACFAMTINPWNSRAFVPANGTTLLSPYLSAFGGEFGPMEADYI
jgi:hypothetical protein